MCGNSERDSSVRLYSTRGGTSAYTVRLTKPSASSPRRALPNILGEMSGMHDCISLLRIGHPFPSSVRRMSTVHLSPILVMTLRTGHSGKRGSVICFFNISSILFFHQLLHFQEVNA